MLSKRLVSMWKRCDHLEFLSFSTSKGFDWYRKKSNRFRKGHKDTKKGTSEDKVGGNLDQWVQCDNCKKGGSYTRLPIFLPFRQNGIVVSILIQTIICVVFLKKKRIKK